MQEKARLALLEKTELLIKTHGWSVTGVFASEDGVPSFSYTTGLYNKGQPELMLLGLDASTGQQLLNDIAKVLVEDKSTRTQESARLINHERWPMAFYLIEANPAEASKWALGAYTRSGGKATFLQVVWPDSVGKFPWQPGYEQKFNAIQPLLGQPPNLH